MEANNSRTCGGDSSGRVQTDDVGEDNPHPRPGDEDIAL